MKTQRRGGDGTNQSSISFAASIQSTTSRWRQMRFKCHHRISEIEMLRILSSAAIGRERSAPLVKPTAVSERSWGGKNKSISILSLRCSFSANPVILFDTDTTTLALIHDALAAQIHEQTNLLDEVKLVTTHVC